MDLFSSRLEVTGVDRSKVMTARCVGGKRSAVRGKGEALPFRDESFDVVYCSFVLSWVRDPSAFISEMLRVSRKWVMCLAEPDTAARIDHPAELCVVTELVKKSVAEVGGNLTVGRQLRSLFRGLGYDASIGVSSGVHGSEMAEWLQDEWEWVEEVLSPQMDRSTIAAARSSLMRCIHDGTAFSYTPIFHAVVDKEKDRLYG
jgi:SAM-dependent methyltransferase